MPDAVQTASTTLSADISGSGPVAADILALSTAIVQGAEAYLQTVLNRRIGILKGVMNTQALPPDFTVNDLALAWNEVQTAYQFQETAQSFDYNLAVLNGPEAQNVDPAKLLSWSNALITNALAYEALIISSLPA
jgi:hypothetical protein